VENGIGAKKYPKDKLQFIEQIISAFYFVVYFLGSKYRSPYPLKK